MILEKNYQPLLFEPLKKVTGYHWQGSPSNSRSIFYLFIYFFQSIENGGKVPDFDSLLPETITAFSEL